LAIDLASLKTEIQTDPQGYGYTGSNLQISNALNLIRVTEVVTRKTISAEELQISIIIAEYTTLTDVARMGWNAILIVAASHGIDVSNTALRNQILAIWGAGTATRSNLATLQTRIGSRAEVLFGEGTTISDHLVEEALLL